MVIHLKIKNQDHIYKMLKLKKISTERLLELLKETFMKSSICWTRRKPFPENDTEFVKTHERDEIVSFLLETCDRPDMGLNVDTFALFVSLLDRILSTYKVKSEFVECLSVACLYIACKVKEEDERISITSEFLLDCESKCSIAELLRMEKMVLKKFEWSVNDTTAVDFLHIFYALLVNEYKNVEEVSKSSQNVKTVWKVIDAKKSDNEDSWYVPADLDFLEEIESQLKNCLCRYDLTRVYDPHVLSFCLLSLQLEKTLASIQSEQIKSGLNKTMDLIEQFCKINFELMDKCKEQLRSYLATVDNKSPIDTYDDEFYKIAMQSLRQSSIFYSPLAAVNSKLDAIKEEEEEEDYMMEMDDSCDYVTRKETETNNFFNSVKFGTLSFAEILTANTPKKRKLSENSCVEEKI